MNIVIWNQILAQLMLTFLLGVILFAAIVTKEVVWIIIAVVFFVLWLLFLLNMIRVIKEELGQKVVSKVNYVYIILLVISFVFLGVSLYLNIDFYEFKKNAEITTAVVYDIKESIKYKTEYDDNGQSYEVEEISCSNYFEYVVNGEKYKSKSNVTSCNYDVGDEVEVYYQVNNPSNMKEKSNNLFFLLALGISLLFLFLIVRIGIKEKFSFSKCKKRKKKRGNL